MENATILESDEGITVDIGNLLILAIQESKTQKHNLELHAKFLKDKLDDWDFGNWIVYCTSASHKDENFSLIFSEIEKKRLLFIYDGLKYYIGKVSSKKNDSGIMRPDAKVENIHKDVGITEETEKIIKELIQKSCIEFDNDLNKQIDYIKDNLEQSQGGNWVVIADDKYSYTYRQKKWMECSYLNTHYSFGCVFPSNKAHKPIVENISKKDGITEEFEKYLVDLIQEGYKKSPIVWDQVNYIKDNLDEKEGGSWLVIANDVYSTTKFVYSYRLNKKFGCLFNGYQYSIACTYPGKRIQDPKIENISKLDGITEPVQKIIEKQVFEAYKKFESSASLWDEVNYIKEKLDELLGGRWLVIAREDNAGIEFQYTYRQNKWIKFNFNGYLYTIACIYPTYKQINDEQGNQKYGFEEVDKHEGIPEGLQIFIEGLITDSEDKHLTLFERAKYIKNELDLKDKGRWLVFIKPKYEDGDICTTYFNKKYYYAEYAGNCFEIQQTSEQSIII